MRSYDDILSSMKAKYTELTGTDPDKASDIGIRMKVLAGELFSAYAELNWLKAQMFPTTADGEYLEMHAAQRGLQRRAGLKARGEVDFYLSARMNTDFTIPAGTVVATGGRSPVRFSTDEDVVIPSGRLVGTAEITALEEGSSGNVMEQEITVIVTSVPGLGRVQNDDCITGGADSETDEQLRARVTDSFVHIPNGTNKAYYIAQAMSVEGVASVGVMPRRRGSGTVDVFVAAEDGTASQAMIAAVQDKLSGAREINVDVHVGALNIVPIDVYMTLEPVSGYKFAEVRTRCEAAIRSLLSSYSGGQDVYVADIGEAVAHIKGVKNYSILYRLMYDTPISDDCAARCGDISIEERGA